MSDETRMNAESKNLEASLARIKLPPAKMDRDELMYQSGWAAAVASLGNSGDTGSSRERPTRQNWIWPSVSALTTTAAISLSVMLFFQTGNKAGLSDRGGLSSDLTAQAEFNGADSEPTANNSFPANATKTAGQELRDGGQVETDLMETDLVEMVLSVGNGQILKSGLAFQEIPSGNDLSSVPRNSGQPEIKSAPTNQRQLMDELLPSKKPKTNSLRTLFFRSNTSS